MIRLYEFSTPGRAFAALPFVNTPIYLVGADGTGKSTICEASKWKSFHYTRDNAKYWLDQDPEWAESMKQYRIFDRHPVVDWPVYQYAFGHMTEQDMTDWVNSDRVHDELDGKTVVWLTHRFVNPSIERGDLPEAVEHANKVDRAYRMFFKKLIESPRIINATIIEGGLHGEFDD